MGEYYAELGLYNAEEEPYDRMDFAREQRCGTGYLMKYKEDVWRHEMMAQVARGKDGETEAVEDESWKTLEETLGRRNRDEKMLDDILDMEEEEEITVEHGEMEQKYGEQAWRSWTGRLTMWHAMQHEARMRTEGAKKFRRPTQRVVRDLPTNPWRQKNSEQKDEKRHCKDCRLELTRISNDNNSVVCEQCEFGEDDVDVTTRWKMFLSRGGARNDEEEEMFNEVAKDFEVPEEGAAATMRTTIRRGAYVSKSEWKHERRMQEKALKHDEAMMNEMKDTEVKEKLDQVGGSDAVLEEEEMDWCAWLA